MFHGLPGLREKCSIMTRFGRTQCSTWAVVFEVDFFAIEWIIVFVAECMLAIVRPWWWQFLPFLLLRPQPPGRSMSRPKCTVESGVLLGLIKGHVPSIEDERGYMMTDDGIVSACAS